MIACFLGNFTRKLTVFIIDPEVNSQDVKPIHIDVDLTAEDICNTIGYEFERVEIVGFSPQLKEISEIYRDRGVKVLCQLS